MTIERRYTGAFDVYIPSGFGGNRAHIDTVFWTAGSVDEVRRSLIGHDGYDSNIIVVPMADNILPLTEKELAELCDDNDVSLVPETTGWFWNGEDGEGDMRHGRGYDSKETAMRAAVEVLELDTNGSEDDAE